jgi:hypothetical protein
LLAMMKIPCSSRIRRHYINQWRDNSTQAILVI